LASFIRTIPAVPSIVLKDYLERTIEYFFRDNSLEEFYQNLYKEIKESEIQNSFIDYNYPKLNKKINYMKV
jgi:hypothetical protein